MILILQRHIAINHVALMYSEYARNTIRKNKRINIRISEGDLIKLKAKSLEEGIPCQTLISSILHKFVTGKIAEYSK